MIVFNVVKEHHGWAVRMGQLMTTPFWSRDLAVLEANRLAASIRRHGERADVVIESQEPREAPAKRQSLGSIGSELVADDRVTTSQ